MTEPQFARPEDFSRQQIAALRQSLAVLHKTLIESERITYEAAFGTIRSKNHFLQLLMTNPWFAWVQPLSRLLADMDECLEAESSPGPEDLARFKTEIRELLKASEEEDGFERSYFEALQREPDVILAHAEVMKRLKGPGGGS